MKEETQKTKLDLENEVVAAAHSAIVDAMKSKLTSYHTPLDELIKVVVAKHAPAIQARLDAAVEHALTGEFGTALEDACTKKLAKVLISKMEGEIEKQANELRQSPEFRSKLVLAISEVVKSFKVPA
jgi:G:T/U-mismatch repair DNA glycosylase